MSEGLENSYQGVHHVDRGTFYPVQSYARRGYKFSILVLGFAMISNQEFGGNLSRGEG